MPVRFDWDPHKARTNLQKHGVSFDEACSVFDDAMFITVLDEEHSVHEERYITIGISARNRLLLIAHADVDETTRIISARKAKTYERRFYEEGL